MKVVFLYSLSDYNSVEHPLPAFSTIPYGLSYVATVSKNIGYDVSIYVCVDNETSIDSFMDFISNEKPDILALTAVSSQYEFIKKIAALARKKYPAIRVILGGVHASLNPDETVAETVFDAICTGEGEYAVFDFVRHMSGAADESEIRNLWVRNNEESGVKKYPKGDFLQDLDALPVIDRGLWDAWIIDKNRAHSVLVGRGCPNKCTYCSNHILCKTGNGRYVRFRSPQNIIEELKYIRKRYPDVSDIHLEVETLSANLVYTKKLCAALAIYNNQLEKPFSFTTNISINKKLINDQEIPGLFRSAGINMINIGLESGSVRVREEILKRPRYSNDELISFCHAAAAHDVKVNLFALIGVPGETYADYKLTVACLRQCCPYHIYLSIYYPYQGTELYDIAKRMGVFDESLLRPELERRTALLKLPGFTKQQIMREYLLFPLRVYYGRKKNSQIFFYILRSCLASNYYLNNLYRKIGQNAVLKKAIRRVAPVSK